jgi:hypothetical protein
MADEKNTSIVVESEILLENSRPDIYRKNAFHISALSVTSTKAEITRQTKLNEMKAKFGGKEDQKVSPFPLNPPPTSEEINNALQKLKDPEKRLVDEFFWFGPHELEEGNSDEALTSLSKNDVNTAQKIWISYENQMSMSNVSMHNLAVLSHLLALDSENENGDPLEFIYELRKSDFERLARPLIIRSINICKKVLLDKRLGVGDIEKVLMVGGTSLIPSLREMLLDTNEGLGIELDSSIYPMTVVAQGAARFACTHSISYNLTKNQ